MKLVLFDFDKTIISKDTGTAFMKFMITRNTFRFLGCLIACSVVLPFLIFDRSKFIGYSIWLWLITVGMTNRQIVRLRNKFVLQYLDNETTIVYKKALEQITLHLQSSDQVIIVSGASRWMVKKIFSQLELPSVQLVCSEEIRFAKGMISSSHCYGERKVKTIKKLFNLNKYESIIGYSDSSIDIPILSICNERVIVNPRPKCFTKLSKLFKKSMIVVHWI